MQIVMPRISFLHMFLVFTSHGFVHKSKLLLTFNVRYGAQYRATYVLGVLTRENDLKWITLAKAQGSSVLRH